MHRDDVGRVLPEPVNEQVLGGDVGGLVARMALLVAVKVETVAILAGLLATDDVDVVLLLLESLPDPRSPAAVVGDGVPERHPAHCRCVCEDEQRGQDTEGSEPGHVTVRACT